MIETTSDPILIEVGARIRLARLDAGLNLLDLARLTGISISALSQIETGKRDLRLTTLAKIARALRLAPSALLDASAQVETDSPDDGSLGYDFRDYD